MITLLGIYRPGRTPMHLAPAWFKMLLLVGMSIACLVISDPVTSVGITAACVLLLASTQPPLKATVKGMAVIVLIACLTTVFQLLRGDYVRALDLAGDLISIAALALAVSSSTSMSDMLELITTLARPLRWILPPETIGVMVSLTLRSIPEAARIITEARVAARARGLDRDMRAVLIPSASRTVGFALQLGQALHARGIAEHGRSKYQVPEPREQEEASAPLLAAPPVREVPSGETPTVTPAGTRRSRRERREQREREAQQAQEAPQPPLEDDPTA
ncbi:energy-coupling factor transporter transmembrane component T family protein [Demequina mangrovi]|uniref:Biotin transport system permease protein n=1 Tax=Demequina mangrovi TaxID=1043493 RepID=A0A1H7B5K6_9MICO|nr:energy-coupling factor transporter transmembrane component T [Demequina mangrovi]SEJ69732.1 biotin transport system permease protein [Demequina mangrovi]